MRKAKGAPVVYYAIDNSALHLHLGALSLRSLRSKNPRIAVQVFLYGRIGPRTRRRFESLGAQVTLLPKLSQRRETAALTPLFQKWEALRHLEAEQVLYADSDTWFFQDPEKLLARCSSRDFYAREEYGTRPGIGYQLLGNHVMQPQLHPGKLKAISVMLDFKLRPIFNTGVMVLNNGFGRVMAGKIPEMNALVEMFGEKPSYFPAENAHIMDEVVSSIIFGRLPRFSCGRIRKEVSPWYCEWKAGAVADPGIVLHYWSMYSPFFVRDFLGAPEARKLPFLIPVEKEYREY